MDVRSQQRQSAGLTYRSRFSHLSETLEVQQLFHNICVGIYVGLAVTAVRSPSKLHIQLKIMQDMMGKLTEAIGNEIKVGVEGEDEGGDGCGCFDQRRPLVQGDGPEDEGGAKIFLHDSGIILTVLLEVFVQTAKPGACPGNNSGHITQVPKSSRPYIFIFLI